jgi:hypothetical protein
MPGTYSKLIYHIIFSTKHLEPLITPALRKELYLYVAGIVQGKTAFCSKSAECPITCIS